MRMPTREREREGERGTLFDRGGKGNFVPGRCIDYFFFFLATLARSALFMVLFQYFF